MSKSSYGIAIAITAFLTSYVDVANAQSTADKVLENLNKAGYLLDPMMGQRLPCPCTLVGVSREGNTETIYIATKGNNWYTFTCVSIKGNSASTLCRSAGQIMGQVWVQ